MGLWHRQEKHHQALPPVSPEAVSAVVDEAAALIEGRVVDLYRAERRPVPRWVWLNALAHRPLPQLQPVAGLAGASRGDPWAPAAAAIADRLLGTSPERAVGLQKTLIVTLELEALQRPEWPAKPDDVLGAVQRRLDSTGPVPPGEPQRTPDNPDPGGRP